MRYVDPDGRAVETAWDLFSLSTGVTSFIANVKEGNIGGAFLDGVGIVVDAAAVILPGIPGGVGALIKGTKATDKLGDVLSTSDKISDATKTINKTPVANGGFAPQHGGVKHDEKINNKVQELLQDFDITDIRKNQQQVDANGNKIGTNRPDLQWTDSEGIRHYWEIDKNKNSSVRHGEVIKKNDPNGFIHLETFE